jgi:DNA polymerase III sliding clamp (beta) subunit (PCNA family)
MAGQIKKMLDQIIMQKSNGNPTLIAVTKTKLILKGLNPDKFTPLSEDNYDLIRKIRETAQEWGVRV